MSIAAFYAKLFATLLIWGVAAGLCYLFSTLGHFDGVGGALMVIIGLIVTAGLWFDIKIK